MPRNWYGDAQSAKQAPRTHSGNRALAKVGGTDNKRFPNIGIARAIYGSTDRATEDHRNDALCVLAPASAVFTDNPVYAGQEYGHNVFRYADHVPITDAPQPLESPSEDYINLLFARADKRGMTIVDYCAAIGVAIPELS